MLAHIHVRAAQVNAVPAAESLAALEPTLSFLERFSDQPFFLFVHTFVAHNYYPHAQYLAPLESEEAAERLAATGSDGRGWVLLDERGEHTGAEALGQIARRLGGCWRLLAVALPAGLLEWAFLAVARLAPEGSET